MARLVAVVQHDHPQDHRQSCAHERRQAPAVHHQFGRGPHVARQFAALSVARRNGGVRRVPRRYRHQTCANGRHPTLHRLAHTSRRVHQRLPEKLGLQRAPNVAAEVGPLADGLQRTCASSRPAEGQAEASALAGLLQRHAQHLVTTGNQRQHLGDVRAARVVAVGDLQHGRDGCEKGPQVEVHRDQLV